MVKPNVVLKEGTNSVTKLRTYPLYDRHVQVGEITAAVELVEVIEEEDDNADENGQLAENTQKTGNDVVIYKIPQTLLPPMQTYIMEVLFWGLRDVQKIRSPSIAIRCGDGKLNSSVIRDYRRFENFDTISGVVQVNLHKYKTPLVIKFYQRKRGGNVYKGICVYDNIHNLFKTVIEEKVWKHHLNQRNVILHERAFSEARSRTEVKINMDMDFMGEVERLNQASRKHKRKHKTCGDRCKKCLKRTRNKTLKTGKKLTGWYKIRERKKRYNMCSIPYLVLSLIQILLWIMQKCVLVFMYCLFGSSRATKMRARYHKLIELESEDSNSDVYDTFNIPEEEEVEDEDRKEDWWSLYYNSVYSSGVEEKIQQIRRESEERKTIRLCKCCNVGRGKRRKEVATEVRGVAV
ncbi:hypothetical protein WDU94_011422 [Cyamophila willieti]